MVISVNSIESLFVLSIPVACISWTITHEEIFREPRDYCAKNSKENSSFLLRKFFYVFTCEYCFSHYVALIILLFTSFKLLFDDWRGYGISWFSLVWVANIYMNLFAFLRTDIKKEKIQITGKEQELKNNNQETGDIKAGTGK